MYKVSEIAEMLAVEKVKIFEALIVHDEILNPYVVKERHLSYLTDEGVKELEKIIFGIEPEIEESYQVIDEEEPIELENDHLDDFIKKNEEKKKDLKNQIIDLKRQINSLDKDLRMKDEAILHYQSIFEDDMKWILDIESKIQKERESINQDQDEKKNGFFNRLMK